MKKWREAQRGCFSQGGGKPGGIGGAKNRPAEEKVIYARNPGEKKRKKTGIPQLTIRRAGVVEDKKEKIVFCRN